MLQLIYDLQRFFAFESINFVLLPNEVKVFIEGSGVGTIDTISSFKISLKKRFFFHSTALYHFKTLSTAKEGQKQVTSG